MRDRPIPFSAPMVRAILAGTKTQTRRVVKDTGLYAIDAAIHGAETAARELASLATRCPYGVPGDRLWVREAWRTVAEADALPPRDMTPAHRIWYEADAPHQPGAGRYRPPMFMPRWASRITLDITGVRVERLQEISEADAIAEGASFHDGMGVGHSGWRHDFGDVHADARSAYARLWNEINGAGSWDANPWAWVLTFKRVEGGANG